MIARNAEANQIGFENEPESNAVHKNILEATALVFEKSGVLRCVHHALHAPRYRGDDKEPLLYFVHDHGVYLMSNGVYDDENNKAAELVYAKDCNPELDEDWWENSRAKVGGDDFVDVVAIDENFFKLFCACIRSPHVSIVLDDDSSFSLYFNT